MLRLFFFGLVAPALLTASSGALATETVLKPITPWNVDWNGKTCTLLRVFGTEEEKFVLWFERFQPSDGFQLIIGGKALGKMSPHNQLSVTYGNGEPRDYSRHFLPGTTSDGLPTATIRMDWLNPPRDKEEALQAAEVQTRSELIQDIEAAVTFISVNARGRKIRLETGSLGKPFAALRKCSDDLVQAWGLDPAVQSTLQRRPRPLGNPGDWAKPSDYPYSAVVAGRQAIVTFRLTIDGQGTPTACDVLRAYADDLFRKRTCEMLMSRARFEGALDAEGQPAASYYVNTVSWIMSG